MRRRIDNCAAQRMCRATDSDDRNATRNCRIRHNGSSVAVGNEDMFRTTCGASWDHPECPIPAPRPFVVIARCQGTSEMETEGVGIMQPMHDVYTRGHQW